MNLTGKNVVVTGANTGIGRVTAVELARRGAHVTLACRSEEKTAPVLQEITAAGGRADFLKLDLGDLSSVHDAAQAYLGRGEPLSVLVNNAGLAGFRGLTKDGFEITFGTNYLGPYLFTRLLLPLLDRAEEARVVTVASKAHYQARAIDWDAVRRPMNSVSGLEEYGVSKLGNILFSNELARYNVKRGAGPRTYSLHPGVVASDVWRRVPWGFRQIAKLFMITNEDGAKTSLHCATSDEVAGESGRYYDECKEKKPSRLALDEGLAKELWNRSAEWVGLPSSGS